MTLDIFQSYGNVPCDSDWLNIIDKCFVINGADIFTSLAGILSGPVALLVEILDKRLNTSFSVTSGICFTSFPF